MPSSPNRFPRTGVTEINEKFIFTEEVLKLARKKEQIIAWNLYNVATEIYKPGRTDFPTQIPQNVAMADLLLSCQLAEVEIQDAILVS